MSLFVDIGQGTGLAGASGVRPYLPPLLAGALAAGDIGLDFDGSGWQFLESPAFLLGVLALAVIAYGAERSSLDRVWLRRGSGIAGLVLGGLMFGGSLAEGGRPGLLGVVAGVLVAAIAWIAVGGLLDRAAARLDEGAASLIAVYADAVALALAAIAIFVPPVAFLALAAFLVLLVRGRRGDDRKYAGLRILR